jgi:hypothetical protein
MAGGEPRVGIVNRLEERYRRVLRLLPASYRTVWEDDMVATFLASVHTDDPDEADHLADFGRPSWSELASVVALAVRLRVGTTDAPPRYAAWSEAIRRSVQAVMLVHAAFAVVATAITLLPAGSGQETQLFSAVIGLLWLPALLALVSGRGATARRLGVTAAAAEVASAILATVDSRRISGEFAYALVLDTLLVLALVALPDAAARLDRRPWLAAIPVCAGLIAGHAVLLSRPATTGTLPPLDFAGLGCLAVAAVLGAHLVWLARHRFGRFSVWTPALAVIASAALGLRLVTLLDFARFGSAGWHPATVTLGVAEAIVVGSGAIVLVLLSVRALRRLPAVAHDAAAWSIPTR